ncbi:MAG: MbcA/ParS/Xre antitoxin family protein [Terracidiphilus sp.]
MADVHFARAAAAPTASSEREKQHGPGSLRASGAVTNIAALTRNAHRGMAKSDAAKLIGKIAAVTSTPAGKMRAELIPDSTWKRARKTLGPQASQTTARLNHVFAFAQRIWGNERDAAEWLAAPHLELAGATPWSLLRTEAGGRAVEALLGALEFGFPV